MIQQIKNAGAKTLTRDVVMYYLNTRCNKENTRYTNLEIYEGLQEILHKMQSGKEEVPKETRNRRMIVE